MVRSYRSKEELLAALQHALGARDAFEALVNGEIDKTQFEGRGYRMMQFS